MKTLFIIFALAGFNSTTAVANSVDRLCRDKAKEVAEDNYRSCMTESRAARLDEIRKEYKSDLRELKARYEEKIRKLKANKYSRQNPDTRTDSHLEINDNGENRPIERVGLPHWE